MHRYLRAISEHDGELHALTAEAAHVCNAPVALLGFVDGDGEKIKVSIGWNVDALPLVSSFAARCSEAHDVAVYADAATAPAFAQHPFVTGAPNVRFIAAVPLIDATGVFIGAVSVLDRVPHQLQPIQVQMLRMLGRQVLHVLESRA